MADYERWNDKSREAFKYDAPYFNEDLGNSINYCKKLIAEGQPEPYRRFEIETKDGKHIGFLGAGHFKNINDVQLGISIMEDTLWSKGLGTEAFSLLVDYIFTAHNLTRLGYSTWSGNERMMRLGKKLGFVEEGRIRRSCFVRGVFYDGMDMGILREEWLARKAKASL